MNSQAKKRNWKGRLVRGVAFLVILAVPLAAYGWYKFVREVPQPAWITTDPEANFLHGSIGGEAEGGIPYWIVAVLPRIFDDLMPGPGGYAAFGLPWIEGTELPVGFSRKTVGFERVGFNCALCHATQYRTHDQESPVIVAAGGSHTADIQALLEFFSRAANDPRFNAETILTQIDLSYPLSWVDRQLYKYLYIPIARKRLQEQGRDFAWADDLPRWGPGRDAPMNLTKFNFLDMPVDGSVDNTSFPSLWNLQARVQPGRTWPEDNHALTADWSTLDIEPSRLMLMNLDGATTSFRAVVIDSALGLQAQNTPFFRQRVQELEDWLLTLPAPAYPLPIDAELAATGQTLFEQHCAGCHAAGRDNRLGTVIPLAEIGTDPERAEAWSQEAADAANRLVRDRFKLGRTPMGQPEDRGYIALQLDGVWLRGPYLHNGSVPTLRALLEPEERRPRVFYSGYDVIDRWNGGFVSRRCAGADAGLPADRESLQWGCMPRHEGWLFDTAERGNSNRGHAYGTTLDEASKDALVEYLKTL
ncbi:cytochrome c [Thioalkalicoccus limnaeus]|uniref:Cytochrome c n=1 Tax=Thioalkalicoccus limnaeus TaxID=120681 RepID=A0ABV4BCX1_9GAMM